MGQGSAPGPLADAPRPFSSCSPAAPGGRCGTGRSVTDRPQRSRRHTSTTSTSRRRAAANSFSRACRCAAPEPPPGPASQWSSPAGQHIPARRDSASPKSAGRWWKHGRTDRPATFSPVSVPGQKRIQILLSQRPVLWAFCMQQASRRKNGVWGPRADRRGPEPKCAPPAVEPCPRR